VNSIAIVSNTSILALGMEDYGLILYDILEYRILKFIPMAPHLLGERKFYVNALVPQAGQFLLHVVINNNAAFSMRSTS
jgi:hypothetical protein